MHLPLAHLSGFEEDENEELQAQLQANSGSGHSHEDEEGSQSHSQGSKEGSGGSAPDGGKPPKDLPCPRCQSMNTKFCYYNNYSVNQPRHFCRNCQRYWTVGGTLRNVPVGGGSRKKTRTRSRSDPYYRPGTSPAPAGSENESDGGHHAHPAVAAMASAMAEMGPLHPDAAFDAAGFGDFPFHPAQMATFLQLAMQQSAPGMGLNPFGMDRSGAFPMSPEDEAELQAFYEATQGGFLPGMMNMGLFLPELEPAHLALMHKAALWAEAQRLQTMARRQTAAQAAAWAAESERECKPSVGTGTPPAMGMHPQRSVAMEAELRHRQQAHRRPGFWETALMHSRPSSKATRQPGSSSQTPWDAESKPLVQNETPQQQQQHEQQQRPLDEENVNAARDAAAAASAYSQGYVVDETSSWGSGLNGTPEMYY